MSNEALQREYEQIGARIRNARIERKMSQAELAAKANISLPHISSIELGKTKMLLSTFTTVSYTHLDVYKRQVLWHCA